MDVLILETILLNGDSQGRGRKMRKKKKKGKGNAKPNSFLNPYVWYSNDIKREQVNGERHILVLMRKQLSDFNYNGVTKRNLYV